MCVVNRVLETQRVAYSVDVEFVEHLLRDKQRDVYADVLAVIEPAYNAAALLWEEQAAGDITTYAADDGATWSVFLAVGRARRRLAS